VRPRPRRVDLRATHADGGEAPAGVDAPERGLGDLVDFVAFYRERNTDVFRYFHRQVLCPEIAADLTAETFAQALEHRSRYEPSRGNSSQWIFGIARNHLRMWIRSGAAAERARRRMSITTPAFTQLDLDAVAAATDVESVVPSLQEAIASLPPADQSIVRLRVVERLDYATLAEQLACTEGAARVRASRALARLRRELLERVPDLEERLA
jgi:RNA polymerase sigma factor (sigma-70 family)